METVRLSPNRYVRGNLGKNALSGAVFASRGAYHWINIGPESGATGVRVARRHPPDAPVLFFTA
jgi:hypothetical protein